MVDKCRVQALESSIATPPTMRRSRRDCTRIHFPQVYSRSFRRCCACRGLLASNASNQGLGQLKRMPTLWRRWRSAPSEPSGNDKAVRAVCKHPPCHGARGGVLKLSQPLQPTGPTGSRLHRIVMTARALEGRHVPFWLTLEVLISAFDSHLSYQYSGRAKARRTGEAHCYATARGQQTEDFASLYPW